MKAIKLYAKTCCKWKSLSIETAVKEMNDFFKIEKFEKFQFPKYDFKKTNRKLKPYDVEVSYYGWDTLEQMAKDKQSSSNKEIKDTKRE